MKKSLLIFAALPILGYALGPFIFAQKRQIAPRDLRFEGDIPAHHFGTTQKDLLNAMDLGYDRSKNPGRKLRLSARDYRLSGAVVRPYIDIIGVGRSSHIYLDMNDAYPNGMTWDSAAPMGGLKDCTVYPKTTSSDPTSPVASSAFRLGPSTGFAEGMTFSGLDIRGSGNKALFWLTGSSVHNITFEENHFKGAEPGADAILSQSTEAYFSVRDTTFVGFNSALRIKGSGQVTASNIHVESPTTAGFWVDPAPGSRRPVLLIDGSRLNHRNRGPFVAGVPFIKITKPTRGAQQATADIRSCMVKYGLDIIHDPRHAGKKPLEGRGNITLDADGKFIINKKSNPWVTFSYFSNNRGYYGEITTY